MLKSNVHQLARSIGNLLLPIVAKVLPYLNAIVIVLKRIVEYIGTLIGIKNFDWGGIGGIDNSGLSDVLDEADDLKSGLDDATESAKKLKKSVLGFDELNQLSDNKDSDSKSNGLSDFDRSLLDGAFSDALNKYLEEWQKSMDGVISKAEELANAFIDAWKKGKGALGAWKRALKSVWNLLQDIGRDFLLVWHEEETRKIFENLGKILENLGNTVANLADRFREAWNKADTGRKIFENIRDICAIIVEHVKNITASWEDWSKKIDFSPLLQSFERFIESLKPFVDAVGGVIQDINDDLVQPLATWIIEKGLSQLTDAFTNFMNSVHWEEIRTHLDNVWNALEPFGEEVGQGLVNFADSIGQKIADFVNSETFTTFLDNVARIIDEIDGEQLGVIAEGIAQFVLDIIEALTNVFNSEPFQTFCDWFIEWYNSLTPNQVKNGLMAIAFGIGGFKLAVSGFNTVTNFTTAIKSIVDFSKKVVVVAQGAEVLGAFGSSLGATAVSLGMLSQAIEQFKKNKKLSNAMDDFEQGKITADEFSESLKGTTDATYDFNDAFKDFFKIGGGVDLHSLYENKIKPYFEQSKKGFEYTGDASIKMSKDVGLSIQEYQKDMEVFKASTSETYRVNTITASNYSKDLSTALNDATKVTTDVSNRMSNDFDKVRQGLSKDRWTFRGVADGLRETFSSALNGVKDLWNKFADKLNGSFSFGDKEIHINIPKLPAFANGGFPEDGLFMANHGELVGKFNNGRTAVANNEMIIQGIENAVYRAMMQASQSGSNNVIVNAVLKTENDEVLARAVTRGQQNIARRYSPTMT